MFLPVGSLLLCFLFKPCGLLFFVFLPPKSFFFLILGRADGIFLILLSLPFAFRFFSFGIF